MRRVASRIAAALATMGLAGAAGPWATAASAQVGSPPWPSIESLRPGDTVRVWSSVPRIVGAVALVERLERDTLALRDVPGRRVLPAGVAVPVPALIRLDVQRGHRRSAGRTLAGVALGLAGGTIVGAYAGVAVECGGSCSGQGDLAGIAGLVIGGGLGGLTGAIVGGAIGAQRRPRWEPVGLPVR